jgi:hypothetical protein
VILHWQLFFEEDTGRAPNVKRLEDQSTDIEDIIGYEDVIQLMFLIKIDSNYIPFLR